MKRVTVHQNQRTLVYKNDELLRILSKGKHWLSFGETYEIHALNEEFAPSMDLKTLLKDESLASQLYVLDIMDREKMVVYADNKFQMILSSGLHAFWKGYYDYRFTVCDLRATEIPSDIDTDIINCVGLASHVRMIKVESSEQAILIRNGDFYKILTGGTYYYWNNDISLEVMKVDMRTSQMEISGQEILSKDKAALRINYQVQYKVADIKKALLHTADFKKQLYVFAQLALRTFVGSLSLDELLENRSSVNEFVQTQIKEQAHAMGVIVLSSGLKDIILTGEMKDIMNQVLMAQKRAEANVITRREETASTRSLLNTAKLMENNTMLFKLKEMEYIEKITDKVSNISISGGAQIAGQLKDLFSSS